MVQPPPESPLSFSVQLVQRRASSQSLLSRRGAQKPTHYNLRRLSQDYSQAPPNLHWYGKASENFEAQMSTVPKAGSLQRRFSQIPTSSKLWRDDASSVTVDQYLFCAGTDRPVTQHFQKSPQASASSRRRTMALYNRTFNRPQTAPAASRPASVASCHHIYNLPNTAVAHSRPSSVASCHHTYNLPNTRFCVEQDQVEIDYKHDKYQKLYPQLPLHRLSARYSAEASRASKVLPVSATASQVSLSSIYSGTTEASFTLELTADQTAPQRPARHISGIHDTCNRNMDEFKFSSESDEQSTTNPKSRMRPLTQCFKRVKPSGWLDKAGKRIQSFKNTKLQNLFKKQAASVQQKRMSVNAYVTLAKGSIGRRAF